jgi:spermidine synthase
MDRYGIKNEYVNSFYIHDELFMERSRNLIQQIDTSASENMDFKPIAYQTSIKLWLSYFNFWYWLPAVIILLISVFFYFRANALNKAVFAAGFAGTSIELMLLFAFQILYGYVYFAVGIFIMIFMTGLAIGSLYWHKIFKHGSQKLLGRLLASILIFTVSLSLIFRLFKLIALSEILILIIFILLVIIISILTGAVFSISTHLGKKEIHIIASDAYGLDLLGSAAGALLLSVYLVPMLGFELSLIGTAFVCLISFLFVSKPFKAHE